MKNTILFAFILGGTTMVSAQMTQKWNLQNQLNPATNGMYYEQEANVFFQFPNAKYPIFDNLILGSYSTLLEKSKIGVGVNFLHYSLPNLFPQKYNEWNVKVAANRQFSLREDMILSAGLGLGIRQNPQIDFDAEGYHLRNDKNFSADFGLAFRWKRLNLAASVGHFLGNGLLDKNDFILPQYSAFASYTFGDKEKFEILPNASLTSLAGDYYLQTMVIAQYKSKVSLGTGYASNVGTYYELNDTWINTLGYTFYDKYRISYSYVHYLSSKANGYHWGRHELGVSFLLNRRDL